MSRRRNDGRYVFAPLADSSAEPTGRRFDAGGMTAYLVIQHSDDGFMPESDAYGRTTSSRSTVSTTPRAGRRPIAPAR